jgi:hypothetical protein
LKARPSTYHHVFQSISARDLERALGTLVTTGSPLEEPCPQHAE